MFKMMPVVMCALVLLGCQPSKTPPEASEKKQPVQKTKKKPVFKAVKTTKTTTTKTTKTKQCITDPKRNSQMRSQANLMAGLATASDEARKQEMKGHQKRISESEKLGQDAYMLSVKDMDGDGKAEQFYMWDTFGATASGIQHLYLSNKGCWSYAGNFVSGPELGTYLTVLDKKENGMPMIRTFNKSGCAGLAGTLDWYIWDKKANRYQATSNKTVQCSCPDDDPKKGANRHAACPS